MSRATDKSAATIVALPNSGDFDNVGALLTAMRNMLDEGAINSAERRALYVLACMAEATWTRLDDAMTGAAS